MFIMVTFNIEASDIDSLRTRMINRYISSGGSGSYVTSQSSDGSWSDINYSDTDRTSWDPLKHLQRLRSMSIAYNSPGNSYYHNSTLLNGIINGIQYWYNRKSTSANWWFNDIGSQQLLGPILILMQDFISQSLVTTGCTYLKDPYLTALNLVDVSEQTIHRGMLTNNENDIIWGLDTIGSTVKLSEGDGIKSDYSFHQHEKQLYNGGYGLEFIDDITYWIYITRGLSLSMPAEDIETYSNYLLDGMQWMTYKSNLDFSIVGRGISRPGKIKSTSGILSTLNYMSQIGDGRASQYKAYANQINGGSNSLTGDKHFWNSDYHSHRRDDYFVSVRMSSQRTLASETMNGENLKAYYLAYGAMSVLVNQDEYYNIFPVWDWCRVPGVTAALESTPPSMPSWWLNYGKTSFVGGVSNGDYGVSAMDLSLNNIYGKKAWFFFENEVVALGAGIRSSNSSSIITSVNQTLLDGDVVVNNNGQSVYSSGNYTLSDPQWVYHNNVLYMFPGNEQVNLRNNTQSGSWYSINTTYSSSTLYQNVFSLWINHGVQPTNGTYYYTIVPGIQLNDVSSFVTNYADNVISNTSSIQAVENTDLKITGIVFYQAGALKLRNSLTVTADKPCILLLDEANGQLSASNPNQTVMNLNVTLNYSDNTSKVLEYNFPGGTYGGRTIQKSFSTECSLDITDAIVNDSIITINYVTSGNCGSLNSAIHKVGNNTPVYGPVTNVNSGTEINLYRSCVTCDDGNYYFKMYNDNVVDSILFNYTKPIGCDNFALTGEVVNNDYGLTNGSILISIGGGSEPYSYSWSDGITTKDRSNLSSGEYTIIVTDANSCELSETFSILENADPCLDFSISGEIENSYNGLSNGSIMITVSGGSEPFTYTWNDGVTDKDRTNLSAGTYSVTINDFSNCTITKSFQVEDNSIKIISTSIIDGVLTTEFTTSGDCSTVTYIIYDATNSIVYNPGQTVQTGFSVNISNICSTCKDGNYQIDLLCNDLTDSKVFTYVTNIDLCENFIVTGEKIDTEYDNDVGIINLTISGGSEPYIFNWSDGSESQNRDQLSEGTYSVEVIDVNNCYRQLSFTIAKKSIPFEILKFYPNPTTGLVAIEYTSPINATIEIIVETMLGERINNFSASSNIGMNKETIDISADENGNSNTVGPYRIIMRQGDNEDSFVLVKTN